MNKKIFIMCIVFVGAMLFSGCGKNDAKQTSTEKVKGKLYESTFEFSIMQASTGAISEYTTIENEVQKKLNCKINYIKVPLANYSEKLNIALAAGELPDMVYMTSTDDMQKWIDQGAIIPLDPLLSTEGQEITKYYTKEDLGVLKSAEDGKIYGIAGINEMKEINSLGIRKDWLEKLSLTVPETLDQWENVLAAFKASDKLGKSNIIPWAGTLRSFYNAYGIMQEGTQSVWTIDDKNNYISYYEHPRFRELLATLNRLYKNGLIDPEFMVRNKESKSIYELFNTGTAGAGEHFASRLEEITKVLQGSDTKAIMMPVKPIKGPYGNQMILGRDRYYNRAVITATAEKKKKAENIMKYISWTFSPEGTEVLNFGIEGKHYKKIDGKPVLLEEYSNGWDKLRSEGINPNTTSFAWDTEAYKQSLFNSKSINELTEVKRITYDGLFLNTNYIYPKLPLFNTPTNKRKGPDIYPGLKEKEIKAIMGVISIDQFFEELTKAKKDGLDDITKEMNEMWQKIQKESK